MTSNPTPPPSEPRPGLFMIVIRGLITLFFAVGGAFLLVQGVPRVVEGLSARSWPEASGRVVDAEVEEVHLNSHGPGTKRWFEIRVRYDFDVAGRTYRGDRTGLWPERRLGPYARELAGSYPPGRPVRVFYDPANPDRSLLDRSIGGGTWFMVCAGVPILVLGVVMLIDFAREVRRG